jgi:uncharacterized membrane protein
MKISLQQFSVICLILITFAGCKKGTSTAPPVVIPDTTKPTLSIVKPTAAQQFAAGANIPFQVTLTDNEKLKSYDIAVSLKLAGGLILKIVPTSTPFSYTKSATTLGGGKTQDVTVTDINIPANTATNIVTPGTYNFKVTCVDGSDNSNSTTLEIKIL